MRLIFSGNNFYFILMLLDGNLVTMFCFMYIRFLTASITMNTKRRSRVIYHICVGLEQKTHTQKKCIFPPSLSWRANFAQGAPGHFPRLSIWLMQPWLYLNASSVDTQMELNVLLTLHFQCRYAVVVRGWCIIMTSVGPPDFSVSFHHQAEVFSFGCNLLSAAGWNTRKFLQMVTF